MAAGGKVQWGGGIETWLKKRSIRQTQCVHIAHSSLTSFKSLVWTAEEHVSGGAFLLSTCYTVSKSVLLCYILKTHHNPGRGRGTLFCCWNRLSERKKASRTIFWNAFALAEPRPLEPTNRAVGWITLGFCDWKAKRFHGTARSTLTSISLQIHCVNDPCMSRHLEQLLGLRLFLHL